MFGSFAKFFRKPGRSANRTVQHAKRSGGRFRPLLEVLESRVLLTAVVWRGATLGDGSYSIWEKDTEPNGFVSKDARWDFDAANALKFVSVSDHLTNGTSVANSWRYVSGVLDEYWGGIQHPDFHYSPRVSWDYNSAGALLSITRTEAANDPYAEIVWKYTNTSGVPLGKLAAVTAKVSTEYGAAARMEYEWVGGGKPKTQTRWNADGSIDTFRWTYYYDPATQLDNGALRSFFQSNSNADNSSASTTWNYNSNGTPSEVSNRLRFADNSRTETDYSYDTSQELWLGTRRTYASDGTFTGSTPVSASPPDRPSVTLPDMPAEFTIGPGEPPPVPAITPNFLSFVQQPSDAGVGKLITPPVIVSLKDAAGQPMNSRLLTLQLSGGPGDVTLYGDATKTTTNGETTHDRLVIYTPGTYQLSVSFQDAQTIVSDPFTISEAPAPKITAMSKKVISNFVDGNAHPASTAITIRGQNFRLGVQVAIDDLTVVTQRVSETEITAIVSGYENKAEGFRDIQVTNADQTTLTLTGQDGFFVSSLAITLLEVNQGIREATPTHPWVARHPTVVRIKVESTAEPVGKNPLALVLRVLRDGQEVIRRVAEANNSEVRRFGAFHSQAFLAEGKDTFNFVFDEYELPQGNYEFHAEIDPIHPTQPTAGRPATDTVHDLVRSLKDQQFNDSNPAKAMRIAALIDGNDPQAVAEAAAYADFIKAAYPISSDQVSITFVPSYVTYWPGDYGMFSKFFDTPMFRELRVWLLRANEETPGKFTHVFFFTSDPNFRQDNAEGPGLASAGEPDNGGPFQKWADAAIINLEGYDPQGNWGRRSAVDIARTVAHEMGHLYLLGETYDLGAYSEVNDPAITGLPHSPKGVFVEEGGYDFIDDRITVSDPGLRQYDLMSEGDAAETWMDHLTWNYLHGQFNWPTAPRSGIHSLQEEPANWITIGGELTTDDTATFLPFTISTTPQHTYELQTGAYTISVEDENAQVLASKDFSPFLAAPEPDVKQRMSFFLTLPFADQAARVVLSKNGAVLASRAVSANAPTVEFVSSFDQQTLSGNVNVGWQGLDQDNDSLTYTLYHSTDGTSWTPLAVDVTGSSFLWNTELAPGTTTGKLKVVVNDGFHKAEAVSQDTFTIGAKAPLVTILDPLESQSVAPGQRVKLHGSAYDYEDGALADARFAWSSDRDGALGTGANLWLSSLSEGTHVITLTATDSDNNQVQDSITLIVSGQLGAIQGKVFEDPDGNGRYDAGESVLTDSTVYIDANGNDRLDIGELMTPASADGTYQFASLPPGLTFVSAVVPAGFRAPGASVIVPPGGTATGVDLPVYLTARVTSAVTIDRDPNDDSLDGHQDAVAIALSWSGDPGLGSNITGYSLFVSIDDGPFQPVAGYQNTTATAGVYVGEAGYGHTYAFYTVATNDLGQVQTTPTAPQASVIVDEDLFNPLSLSANGVLRLRGGAGNDLVTLGLAKDQNTLLINNKPTTPPMALTNVSAIRVFGMGGNDALTINGIARPIFVEGGAGDDKVVINGLTNAATAFTFGGVTTVGNLFILSGARVTSNGSSVIVNSTLESLVVNGQAKSDTMMVGTPPAVPVAFNAGSGNDRLVLFNSTTGEGSLTFNGGAGTDTFYSAGLAGSVNTWTVTGAGAGDLNGSGLRFLAVESLRGSDADDRFVFRDKAKVTGLIDGGQGTNSLDFSAYKTAGATVDLKNAKLWGGEFGTVIGGGGADKLTASSYGVTFIGNAGNDTLTGGAASDVLIGGAGADKLNGMGGADFLQGDAGNDTLNGGDGDDILLGGADADKLFGDAKVGGSDILSGGSGADALDGGLGEDILIAGILDAMYYNEATGLGNVAALRGIATEWRRFELNYDARVARLRLGLNTVDGFVKLDATMVADDFAKDTLTGGPKTDAATLDWFFAEFGLASDKTKDARKDPLGALEQVN